jgi:hypothetical protein
MSVQIFSQAEFSYSHDHSVNRCTVRRIYRDARIVTHPVLKLLPLGETEISVFLHNFRSVLIVVTQLF